LGFGGHDAWHDTDEEGAAEDLCAVATSVFIGCSIHILVSFHTWQFAEHALRRAALAGRCDPHPAGAGVGTLT
jgi:hypothetical protein